MHIYKCKNKWKTVKSHNSNTEEDAWLSVVDSTYSTHSQCKNSKKKKIIFKMNN